MVAGDVVGGGRHHRLWRVRSGLARTWLVMMIVMVMRMRLASSEVVVPIFGIILVHHLVLLSVVGSHAASQDDAEELNEGQDASENGED